MSQIIMGANTIVIFHLHLGLDVHLVLYNTFLALLPKM